MWSAQRVVVCLSVAAALSVALPLVGPSVEAQGCQILHVSERFEVFEGPPSPTPLGATVVRRAELERGPIGSGGACEGTFKVVLDLGVGAAPWPDTSVGFELELVGATRWSFDHVDVPGVTRLVLAHEEGRVFLRWFGDGPDTGPVALEFVITAVAADGRRSAAPARVRLVDDGVPPGEPTYASIALAAQACDADDARACVWLGKRYAYGVDVTQDRRRAKTLYERACAAGVPHACWYLAEAYARPALLRRARELSVSRCAATGERAACELVASLAARSGSRANNWTRDLAGLVLACRQGVALGCRSLAWESWDDAMERPSRCAPVIERAWAQSCAAGHAVACRLVDDDERGCVLGEPWACVTAGSALLGAGIEPHQVQRAVSVLGRGCDLAQFEPRACVLAEAAAVLAAARAARGARTAPLASSPSVAGARAAFERACADDMPGACEHLALHLEAIARDVDTTALRRAGCLRGGFVPSCLRLAERQVRAAQPVEAVAPLRQACDAGHDTGCRELATLCQTFFSAAPGVREVGSARCRDEGLWRDEERALVACEAGGADLCLAAAALVSVSAPADRDALLRRACQLGSALACNATTRGAPLTVDVRAHGTDPLPPGLGVQVRAPGLRFTACHRVAVRHADGLFEVTAPCDGPLIVQVMEHETSRFATEVLGVAAVPAARAPGPVVVVAVLAPPSVQGPLLGGNLRTSGRNRPQGDALPPPDRVWVDEVEPSGHLARAGLVVGDELVAIDGQPIGPEGLAPLAVHLFLSSGPSGTFVLDVRGPGGARRVTLHLPPPPPPPPLPPRVTDGSLGPAHEEFLRRAKGVIH